MSSSEREGEEGEDEGRGEAGDFLCLPMLLGVNSGVKCWVSGR